MPEPPQVGDCLQSDSLQVVPCSAEHDGEVTARWLADDPKRPLRGSEEECSLAASAYLNFVDDLIMDDWSVPVRTESERIDAPSHERAGTRGWTICSVTTVIDGKTTGSLRSITAIHRPEATASCFNQTSPDVAVPCDQPHSGELLAGLQRVVPDRDGIAPPLGPDGFPAAPPVPVPADWAAQLESECAEVAATLLQSPDPTRGGLLKVDIRNALIAAGPPDQPGIAIVSAQCIIGPTDDRLLTSTLLALGDAEVPLE